MLSLEEVREFFDLRMRLEPWLFREAVMGIEEAALQRAEALVEQMDKAGVDRWSPLNWQLHELLYQPAGRPRALDIVRALHEKSERYFRFQIVKAPIRRMAHAEHMQLIQLSRKRKVDAAVKALEAHIADSAAQILDIVGRMLAGAQAAA
jgi:DNA-binding GntR family transcriptional regulator